MIREIDSHILGVFSVYTVALFKKDQRIAISPDLTGSVLPDPDSWTPWFIQEVDPAGCTSKSGLLVWQSAFARDGYYEFTRRTA
jgi:hypothetical protein